MNSTLRLLLLIVLAGASLGACSESDLIREARPTSLADTAWRVVSINGRLPVPGSEPTAVFTAVEVKGSSGCNAYSGNHTYDPSTGVIAFRDLNATAMACAEAPKNDFEALFLKTFNVATSASIDPGGRLVLTGPGGEIVLAVDAVAS